MFRCSSYLIEHGEEHGEQRAPGGAAQQRPVRADAAEQRLAGGAAHGRARLRAQRACGTDPISSPASPVVCGDPLGTSTKLGLLFFHPRRK